MQNRAVVISMVVMLCAVSCGGDDDAAAEDSQEASATTTSATDPPATDPPATDPPATDPPATDPPATDPPETDPPETDPPATDPPVATTAPPAAAGPELPDTPATALIEQAYDFSGGAPDPDLLPTAVGSVTARWYRAGAVYAVVYDGLAVDAPACPGNSAQTTAGFDFVSNAALPGSTCGPFETAIESTAEQGVQVCGATVSYLTLIPSDYIAVLYASIERPLDDGGGVGLTGVVLVDDPSIVPEIDPATLTC